MTVQDSQRAQSTRERILEASLPLFARHGFAGSSTRAIAKAAGVNVATLAYYFDGKEGLYRSVIERLYEDLNATIPSGGPDASGDTIGWLARTAWSFSVAHQDPMRLLLRHVLDQGSHAEDVVTRHSAPVLAPLQAVVQHYRPDWDAVQSRLFIYGTLHMLMRFAVEDRAQLRILLSAPDSMDDAALDDAVGASIESFMKAQLLRS